MRVAAAVAVSVFLFVGLPLLVLGLAAAGPIGWVAAAVVLPLGVLATLVGLARHGERGERRGTGDPP